MKINNIKIFKKEKKEPSLSNKMISQLIKLSNNELKESVLKSLLSDNDIKAEVSSFNNVKARVYINEDIKIISYNEVFFKPNNVIKYLKRKSKGL